MYTIRMAMLMSFNFNLFVLCLYFCYFHQGGYVFTCFVSLSAGLRSGGSRIFFLTLCLALPVYLFIFCYCWISVSKVHFPPSIANYSGIDTLIILCYYYTLFTLWTPWHFGCWVTFCACQEFHATFHGTYACKCCMWSLGASSLVGQLVR